jgi:pyridoxamine 5'-phosphate oxidase
VSDWTGLPGRPGPDQGETSAPVPALADLRRQYADAPFEASDLAAEPFAQFERWFADARQVPDVIPEPNAMVFATADEQGRPSARTVLLKGLDRRGFVLFTNLTSRKGREALANPHGSLVFPWFPIERQVVVVGVIERVSDDETAAYFHSRPRGAQIGAWTSRQSSVITDRSVLDARRAELEARYERIDIPVPPFWGGLRVVPETVEFWHGRPDRLHDRLRYRREGDSWAVDRLSP